MWYVDRCGFVNWHQENISFQEIGLRAQNMLHIRGSIVNMIEVTYMTTYPPMSYETTIWSWIVCFDPFDTSLDGLWIVSTTLVHVQVCYVLLHG